LALKLGRLPTIKEASDYLGVDEKSLEDLFPNWSKALKYAKLVLENEKLEILG